MPSPNDQFCGPTSQHAASPRDVFITVYGRKPVLEALNDLVLTIDKVIMASHARGDTVEEILDAAARRRVPVQRASAHRVKVLAGNGRHDQGVLADVVAPRMRPGMARCRHWVAHRRCWCSTRSPIQPTWNDPAHRHRRGNGRRGVAAAGSARD